MVLKSNWVNGEVVNASDLNTHASVINALDIHAATAKTTPVDADEFSIIDSAASNVLKKITWADIRTAIESATGNYITETDDLLARMTVRPDADRRAAINTLITSLKANNLWNRLDSLYLFAAHTSQAALLNWRRDTANFSTVNSPIFTADVGFAGDGTASSLTNTNAATVNAVPLDIMTAVWVSVVPVVPSPAFLVWWTGWNWVFMPAGTSTQIQWKLTRTSSPYILNLSSRTGLFTFSRTGANVAKSYRDGALLGTDTNTYDVTGPATTAPLRILSTNGVSSFSTDTVSAAAYGAAYNDAEMALFYNAINDYMTAVDLAGNLGL